MRAEQRQLEFHRRFSDLARRSRVVVFPSWLPVSSIHCEMAAEFGFNIGSWIDAENARSMRVQEGPGDSEALDHFFATRGDEARVRELCVMTSNALDDLDDIFELYRLWMVNGVSEEALEEG